MEQGWLAHTAVPPVIWPVLVPASMLLIGFAVQGWRWHNQNKPWYAALATAGWTILGLTLQGRGSGEFRDPPLQAAAAQVTRLVGNAAVRYLSVEGRAVERPDMQFLLYARRSVPAVAPEDLPDYISGSSSVFVLAVNNARCDEIMCKSGFAVVAELKAGRDAHRLWEHVAEQ